MQKNKAFLIFSGFNQRSVISFCRVARQNNIPICIVALSDKDPIFLTEYKTYVVRIRDNTALNIDDFLEIIKDIKKLLSFQFYTILPSSEALNRFLLKNRKILEDLGCEIPLVSEEIYQMISDKESFGFLCEKNGIKTPQILNRDCINKEYPVVLKPKRYFSEQGEPLNPWIIYNKNDLDLFFQDYKLNDFYIQQYIKGKSYYLLYYIGKNGTVISHSQQNYLQQGKGKSITIASSCNLHCEKISEEFIQLLHKINYFGLIMIELKEMDDELYMIEANPRLWGPIQLTIDCGVPIIEMFIKECDYDIIAQFQKPKKNYYFWLGGVTEAIEKNLGLVTHVPLQQLNELAFEDLIGNEIYKRPDTLRIFDEEKGKISEKGERIDKLKCTIGRLIQ